MLPGAVLWASRQPPSAGDGPCVPDVVKEGPGLLRDGLVKKLLRRLSLVLVRPRGLGLPRLPVILLRPWDSALPQRTPPLPLFSCTSAAGRHQCSVLASREVPLMQSSQGGLACHVSCFQRHPTGIPFGFRGTWYQSLGFRVHCPVLVFSRVAQDPKQQQLLGQDWDQQPPTPSPAGASAGWGPGEGPNLGGSAAAPGSADWAEAAAGEACALLQALVLALGLAQQQEGSPGAGEPASLLRLVLGNLVPLVSYCAAHALLPPPYSPEVVQRDSVARSCFRESRSAAATAVHLPVPSS
jgi:hypothetical protein